MKTYKITYKVGNVEYAVIVNIDAQSPEEAHEKFARPPSYIDREMITKVEEMQDLNRSERED